MVRSFAPKRISRLPGDRQDDTIAIVGLGYTGLPLAVAFVEAGLQVEGIDTLHARVEELRSGASPIDDIDDARLKAALGASVFCAVAIYLAAGPFGSRTRFDGVLRFRLPAGAGDDDTVGRLLHRHCRRPSRRGRGRWDR